MWNGNILHPPKTVNKNLSLAWKFGGFMANSEGKIDYCLMVCGECGLKMVYRSSPSNLLQHLSGAHLISALKSSGTSSTTKISSFLNKSKVSQIKKYKHDHPTHESYLILDKKHQKMTSELFNKVIFLSDCI